MGECGESGNGVGGSGEGGTGFREKKRSSCKSLCYVALPSLLTWLSERWLLMP